MPRHTPPKPTPTAAQPVVALAARKTPPNAASGAAQPATAVAPRRTPDVIAAAAAHSALAVAPRDSITLEQVLAEFARTQDGVASTRQLHESGWTRGRIATQLRNGRFRRMHPGVLALGPGTPTIQAQARAALLAVGHDAVLSHRWAASAWGFARSPPGPVEVTVPSRSGGIRTDLSLHRVRALDPADITTHHRFPVTTPERTLLDLAAVESFAEVERLFDDAIVARCTTPAKVGKLLDRCGPRPGVVLLRELVENDYGPMHSELEREFRRFWRLTELPEYQANAPLLGYKVDVLWPEHRVVVELDSRRFHDDVPGRREQDRLRSARLQAEGFVVVRISHRRLTGHPIAVAAELGQILGRAAAS